MAADASGGFPAYLEPSIISILTLVSFFLLLAIAEWLADKVIRASLIGHIIVGLIYGLPIANVLARDWQETFLALGYIGLILLIFEGGLTVRLDLLRQNLILSLIAALLGVLTPIALSFALLYAGFHHAPLEAFIVGTALCSTSLGTTFVVLSSASEKNTDGSLNVDFSQSRIGTVLISAALLDDVCGLVLVSVIHNLHDITGDGDGGSKSLGWFIGRPVLASVLMTVLAPAVAKSVVGPVYRRFIAPTLAAQLGHVLNILPMAVALCGFLAIAAYAGASVLFGTFPAGAFLSGLPTKGRRPMQEERGPEFTETFRKYLAAPQKYIFQPLFFASIGFAIPFQDLWMGELIVGIIVPAWDLISSQQKTPTEKTRRIPTSGWAPPTLLGAAMVARGETGLLIIQIGLNETTFLSQKAFVIGVWAIVLNTMIGPVLVGILLKQVGSKIAKDARWGVQAKHSCDINSDASPERTGTSDVKSQGAS
ncbi:hypothetical protein VTI74DRAFT_7328 [Chaetomium olivicolor]